MSDGRARSVAFSSPTTPAGGRARGPAVGRVLERRLAPVPDEHPGHGRACHLLGVFALLAVFAPMLSPYALEQVDLMATFQRPSGAHWLGTDALGRDIWSGIWEGARVSLTVGLTAALGQMVIGLLSAASQDSAAARSTW